MTPNHFEKVLSECSDTATKSFHETVKYQQQLATIINDLHNQLSTNIDILLSDQDAVNFEFSQALDHVVKKIGLQTQTSLTDLEQSLKRKKKSLHSFTLSLFGRTKAGKSTIREALTNGDGKTIGKGAQRTTRDVLEYSWKGLRLIDVPGIEAYKGDDDTQKAHDIIDESDMIVFLTTDDSVQPGEFDEMSRLKEINKHFFVVMNVKYSLFDGETEQADIRRIERFVRRPEKIFDINRLKEHRNHIGNYVKTHLNIPHIDVLWIHAQAAFLSTKPELVGYSDVLWKLSQLDTLYKRLSEEINRYGKHRRVLTFYDSLIHFVDTFEKMLWEEQKVIRAQAKYMVEKRGELQTFFNRFIPESNRKIEDHVTQLYAPIKQWIPGFVEEYIGRDDAQRQLEKHLKERKSNIQQSMDNLLKEIVSELHSHLTEFTRQYQYDIGSIRIESEDIGMIKKGQIGKMLKWGGVVLGAASTGSFVAAAAGWGVANIWNPVGWIALGASSVVGLLSWLIGDHEKKKWQRAKSEANEALRENIEKMEKKTLSTYKTWFYKHITKKGKREMFDQVSSYIKELYTVADLLREFARKTKTLKNEINKQLYLKLLQLEGVPCTSSDLISISREPGVATKIIVPTQWCMDGSLQPNLSKICGEQVFLISIDSNVRSLIAKTLNYEKVSPKQVSFEMKNNERIAVVQVPTNIKGLIIGKNATNIRLAQELCGLKIVIT